MNRDRAFAVAWFRFRATFRRRWGTLLVLVVLIALSGGMAMGALAGARRTQSSFNAFLASTNPEDLGAVTAVYNPTLGFTTGNDPSIMNAIARLPHVTRAESYAGLNVFLAAPDGTPLSLENPLGSIDGMFFDQDRVTVTRGRMADPGLSDEFVMSAASAKKIGAHIGDVFPLAAYSMDQSYSPDFDPATATPFLTLGLKLVGLVVFNNTVVYDDIDASGTADAVFTPALTDQLTDCCSYLSAIGVKTDGDSRDIAAVEAEIEQILPPALPRLFNDTSIIRAKAERAIKPETIALAAFGVIATLAALVIASQVIGRQVRAGAEELMTLRALGAGPAMTMMDGLMGIIVAVVVGSVLAALVAALLSPLAPIGPVRPVYPSSGFAFDWTVLGPGIAVLTLALTCVAMMLAYRGAPQREGRRRSRVAARAPRVARAVAAGALPVSAVAGVGFALEPTQSDRAPVRAAMLGTVLGMVIVVATLTFGASLNALVSHPALYGWNWDVVLNNGINDIPQDQAAQLLDSDPDIAAWSGIYFAALQIDGQTVPVVGTDARAAVGPPTLSGHGLEASNQIVLGATTLAQLHKHVGDTVEVSSGTTSATQLEIVGTATMPTIGEGVHPTMGTGALLSYELIPASTRNIWRDPVPGPNALLVRYRAGTDLSAADASLQEIASALSQPGSSVYISVLRVQRPAEIVNYRSMRITPLYLGSALAGGAMFALALTLIASVRRRRHDLALLKTFGFTSRQLAAVVAWQSSVAVAIGTVVGVPVGVILGRVLWEVFAGELHAVARPNVPVFSIVLVSVGALVLANIVAAVPGRIAARTPTALLLRAQ